MARYNTSDALQYERRVLVVALPGLGHIASRYHRLLNILYLVV